MIRRAIGAAAIGNITEWYDFGVYGYLQVTIEGVFLPKDAGPAGAIIVAALFAVAFLVRPLGGMFFGPLADKIGRKSVLATTMIMMALGTFLIGVLPDYATIGLAAPFLLLACRLVQGFSTGGEYGNAMAFIAEYAPDRRRGFLGSLLEVGTFGGYVLGASIATIMTAVLTEDQLLSWGWRLPFFVALPLGLVGVYLRSKLEDTPAYRELEKQQDAEAKKKAEEKKAAKSSGRAEARDAEKTEKKRGGEFSKILQLWPNLLACMGLVLAWNVTNYMLTAFMPQFFPMIREYQGSGGVSELASSILQIIVMVMCLVLIPVIGRLSDRVGRKAVVRAGSIALIVLSFPSLALIRGHSDATVLLGLLIMGLSLICFSATMPSTLPSLFPTAVRAGALSISFNVAISLFGGTTSTVMTSLVTWNHFLMWPAVYLVIAGVIGLICVHIVPESNGRPLWGSKPAATDREEATAHAKELTEEAEAFALAHRAPAH
ncbi:MFS transporter [Brachybacterium endophyticum]|uniref:Putative proline/betaine transporter n=1 Tax=Brachybacterium endophyticum TaxID=2182385 RepID=A0A2U2RHS7_9MICO|nr:MFS transporter [Brachybacterium endophyticum]